MRELIAGVDLGGTNIRIAVSNVHRPDVFLSYRSAKTPVEGGPSAFLRVVSDGLSECCEELGVSRDELAGLGCTIPGITDAGRGISLSVTNLTGWDGYPIKSEMESSLGVRVAIDNDVNAAALGEYWYGQGRKSHSVVYLTISTGIAAGIVIEGKLLRGFHHAAGEVGFFMPDHRLMERGWEPNGCLELTSAGVGLARAWSVRKRRGVTFDATAEDVFKAAERGDREAGEVIRDAADYLAQAVIAIVTIVDPERVVLSGSIAQHQLQIFHRICDMVKKHIPHAPEISISNFEGDAPLIGALALIARELEQNIQ